MHLVSCAAALLPALAMFDLPGFVLLLSRRLAAGGAEPSSPTHVMSFLALLRLAHSQQARRRAMPVAAWDGCRYKPTASLPLPPC